MGVALYYETTDQVPADIRSAILAETERINQQRDWWSECLLFYDLDEEEDLEPLRGSTKISLVGYSAGNGYLPVDADDNSLMAWRDTAFIVRQLCAWSLKYGLNWRVEMVGEPIGEVSNGRPDDELRSYLDRMLNSFPPVDDIEKRAKEISLRYASRNEDEPDCNDEDSPTPPAPVSQSADRGGNSGD